jgi:hypothetical protein
LRKWGSRALACRAKPSRKDSIMLLAGFFQRFEHLDRFQRGHIRPLMLPGLRRGRTSHSKADIALHLDLPRWEMAVDDRTIGKRWFIIAKPCYDVTNVSITSLVRWCSTEVDPSQHRRYILWNINTCVPGSAPGNMKDCKIGITEKWPSMCVKRGVVRMGAPPAVCCMLAVGFVSVTWMAEESSC